MRRTQVDKELVVGPPPARRAFPMTILNAIAALVLAGGGHEGHTHDTGVTVGTSSMLDSTPSATAAAQTTVHVGTAPYYWSMIPSTPSGYEIMVGSKISFRYSTHHNVYLMASQSAYDSCTAPRARRSP